MLDVRSAQIFANAICKPPVTEFATQLLEIKRSLSLIFMIPCTLIATRETRERQRPVLFRDLLKLHFELRDRTVILI